MNLLTTVLICAFQIKLVFSNTLETYDEHLQLTPLPDGKVSARFAFNTVVSTTVDYQESDDRPQHYRLFPLALGQLLRAHSISELHLTLNAGKWDYEKWGYPADQSVAGGAELWVWMFEGHSNATSVDRRWKDLSNGLAGLFCSSLGALDQTRTTTPRWAFSPEGDYLSNQNYQLRHAFLPSESVCTENLTPFLKLLPCKGKSGLSSLLNPHPLFASDWHGIGVHFKPVSQHSVELRMTFGAVLDPVRASGGKRDWSFETLFGRPIMASCPASTRSLVSTTLPTEEVYRLTPEPTAVNDNVATHDLKTLPHPFSVALAWPEEQKFRYSSISPSLPLTARRSITGGSQSRGGILFNFVNNQNVTQDVVCVETAPWFINYFLNTRRVTVNGVDRNDIILDTWYTLPRGHSPSLLETTLRLPPNSQTQMSMSFLKSFIAYTEHPPDAERGWDLPAAAISFTLPSDGHDRRIYTRNALIDLPTPDFSMPYNVIIMSSTVIALFFGSIFNLLTRRFVWVKTQEVDVVHQY